VTKHAAGAGRAIEVLGKEKRVIVVSELNGLELAFADSSAGSETRSASHRAIFAIRKVGGQTLPELKDDFSVGERLQSFSAQEINRVMRAYGEAFAAPENFKGADPFVDSDGFVSATARSGRVFKLRELNGLEQAEADGAARFPIVMPHYRCAASLVSIDGKPVNDKINVPGLESRLKAMTHSELEETVMAAYSKCYALADEALGNESTATDSQPSS
jgi:hypothetical protein